MRLTERLLLLDVSDDNEEPGDYLLVDEVASSQVWCDVEDGARLIAGIIHFAAIRPAFKEAVLACLLGLDAERRAFARRVLADAAEDLRRAEEEATP